MGIGRKSFLFGGLALGAALAISEQAEAERLRKARKLSGEQIASLIVLGALAVLAVWGLSRIGAGPLGLLPPILWFYAVRGFRQSNERRAQQRKAEKRALKSRPRPELAPKRKPRPYASEQRAVPTRTLGLGRGKVDTPQDMAQRRREQQHREAEARRNSERLQRAEGLGIEGSALYGRAESAIRRILSTELARRGELGSAQELDFGPDLKMIEEKSRAAVKLQKLVKELSGLPNPTGEDRLSIEEATRKIDELSRQSRERVEMLEAGWEEAKAADLFLRKEREQAALNEKRDDVHGRLAAALFGADAATDRPPSSAAERVLFFGAAYRELRGVVELEPIAEQASSAGAVHSKRNPFSRLRRRNRR